MFGLYENGKFCCIVLCTWKGRRLCYAFVEHNVDADLFEIQNYAHSNNKALVLWHFIYIWKSSLSTSIIVKNTSSDTDKTGVGAYVLEECRTNSIVSVNITKLNSYFTFYTINYSNIDKQWHIIVFCDKFYTPSNFLLQISTFI